MNWLPITLLCALALAASDAVAKKTLSALDLRSLTTIRLGLAGLLMTPLLWEVSLADLPADFWLWMLLLVPLEIVAMLLYMKAIRDHPLSLTVPYLAFTPAFVMLSGWLILDEQVSLQGFAGIGLIVVGAWLLNVPEKTVTGSRQTAWQVAWRPFRSIASNPGSRFMLIAALIYSFTASGSKAALQYMPAEQFGAFYFASIGLVVLLLFGRHALPAVAKHWKAAAMVALLMAVMVFLHFVAISMVEAAYMVAVKRSSMLFGIVFGVLFFAEKHLGVHLFAAGLMLAGVFVIVA